MTQEFLQSKFYYKDGFLFRIKDGTPLLGVVTARGYRRCCLFFNDKGRCYTCHRLIFLFIHGFLPKIVDHKNGDKLDNRIENLREANGSQNSANKGTKKKYKGVYAGAEGKFYSQIKKDKKYYYVGCFETDDEAARAYDAKAKELHGEFAWLNFPD